MSLRLQAVGFGLVAALMTACQPSADQSWRAQVEPVPEVSLARREAGDVKRLSDMRRRIEQTLAQPDLSTPEAARAYSELGRQYMAHEYDRAALVAFGNLVAVDPNWRTGHYLRAVLLQHEGQLEQARAHLNEALRIDPNDGNTLLRLGDVALSGGDSATAQGYFERAMAIPSTAFSGQAGLGRTAFFDRDYPAAVAALSAVLEQRPLASALRHPLAQSLRELGQIDAAKAQLALAGSEPLNQADPLVDSLGKLVMGARTLLSRAYSARAAGEFEAAEAHFRAAIAADGEFALAPAGLGQLMTELGRHEEALSSYRRAIEIDPEFPEAWFDIGTAELRLGRAEAAEAAFKRVLEIDPEHLDARFRFAAILHGRGEIESARDQLERILAKNPNHVQTLLSLVMLELAAQRRDSAQRRLAEAMALPLEAAERSSLLALTAHLANTDGDTPAAMTAYRGAVDADASNFDAWFNLAMLQRTHGSEVDAQKSFSAALELRPEHEQARLALARTQIALGQWPAARDTLDAGKLDYRADNQILMTLIELLAASPDAAVRDGDRALHLAEQATRETRNLRFMELTAMAAAELGEFEQAAGLIERLIDTAQKQSAPAPVRERLNRALVSYRARQAIRMSAD